MYKKITIIEELKKEFVITHKGEELLVGLNRSIKKYDDWRYEVGTKNERTTIQESDEYENEIARWRKLDKINRAEIIKIEQSKKKQTKVISPNFKKEEVDWKLNWQCSKCQGIFSRDGEEKSTNWGKGLVCSKCFTEMQNNGL